MGGLAWIVVAGMMWTGAATAGAGAGAPVLAVGDFFETRDLIVPDSAPTSSKTFRETVEAIEPLALNGTTYDAVKLVGSLVLAGAPGSEPVVTNATITRWLRASDGAVLKMVYAQGETTSETLYEAPCVDLRFPVSVGDSWTSVCSSTTTSIGGGRAPTSFRTSTNASYRVLGEAQVTVPAGVFDAFEIERSNEGHPSTPIHSWYAPGACTTAKTLEDSGGYNDSYELMVYHCASVQGGGAGPTKPVAAPGIFLAALALGSVAVAARPRR